MCKHLGISAVNGKQANDNDDSVVKENLSFCNHAMMYLEDFSILATSYQQQLMLC